MAPEYLMGAESQVTDQYVEESGGMQGGARAIAGVLESLLNPKENHPHQRYRIVEATVYPMYGEGHPGASIGVKA